MKSYISRKFPLETRTTDQIFDFRSLGVIIGLWVLSLSPFLLGELLLSAYPRVDSCPQTFGRRVPFNICRTNFSLRESFCDRVLNRIRSVSTAQTAKAHMI